MPIYYSCLLDLCDHHIHSMNSTPLDEDRLYQLCCTIFNLFTCTYLVKHRLSACLYVCLTNVAMLCCLLVMEPASSFGCRQLFCVCVSCNTTRTASERHQSDAKNRAHPGCRWDEVQDQGSLDYHLQRIPSALMHCRCERLMLIPYRR